MTIIEYQGFFQKVKWLGLSSSGRSNGKIKSGRLLQALQVRLVNPPPGLTVIYDVRFPVTGWEGSVSNGTMAGKIDDTNEYIDGIVVELVNRPLDSKSLSVAYRAFTKKTQTWTDYSRNGETLNVSGGIEAIQIKLET